MSQASLPRVMVGSMRLGAWGKDLDTQSLEYFIDGALDMGFDHFDHADIYGGHTTEGAFGEVIRRRPELKKKLQLHTKCGIIYPSDQRPEYPHKSYDSSSEHIRWSVENSLKELGVDSLASLLIHRPDHLMESKAVASLVDELKSEGKIQRFGVSNFNTSQVAHLSNHSEVDIHQFECSIIEHSALEDGRLLQCMDLDIQAYAWSPLAGGAQFSTDSKMSASLRTFLYELAKDMGIPLDTLWYAWLFKHPSRLGIVTGTTDLSRLENARMAMDIELDASTWYDIHQRATGKKLP